MKNLIIAAVLLMPAAAGAQGNIKLGNLEINPFVSTQESYDSNIYLQPKYSKIANPTAGQVGRKSALINRTAFGVDMIENLGARYNLKAGYSMELLGYSRDTGINNATHHNANIGAMGKLPKDITVTVDDKWKQTTDQATSQTTERAKRIENTMGLNVNAPLRGKFGFNLAVNHVYNNYMDSTLASLDREELLMGFDVDYKWQPKTKLFFAYRHGMLNYQQGYVSDATYENMEVGATGNIAPKVQGTVKAGVQMRKYDEALNSSDDSVTTGGYSAQAIWKAMEKTEVTLFAKRANVEANYGDSRFYTSTLTDLNVTREIGKIKAGIGMNYEGVLYSEKYDSTDATDKVRFDENASVRLTAEYNIQKWLKADFAYTYKDRSSNFDAFEYKDNIIALGLKATF